jgi:hypothetical protein
MEHEAFVELLNAPGHIIGLGEELLVNNHELLNGKMYCQSI